MKEVTSSTWVFSLIITFIFLFSAFLSLSITYSKTFKLKNEMLSIIEKYEGINPTSKELVNNLLHQGGYNTKGYCNNYAFSEANIEHNQGSYVKPKQNEKYFYCINEIKTSKKTSVYEVKLFFKFNLPIFGELTTFDITGKTKKIYS